MATCASALYPLVYAQVLDAGLPPASAEAIATYVTTRQPPRTYADRCELSRSLRKLRARLKGAWHGPVSRHARLILSLQRNRVVDADPRPAEMRGVEPDWRATTHVAHPHLLSADDWPLGAQAQVWAQSLLSPS